MSRTSGRRKKPLAIGARAISQRAVFGKQQPSRRPIRKTKGKMPPEAIREISALYLKSENWANRAILVADKILAICANHGVPLAVVKNQYLRRIADGAVLVALQKRLSQLERKPRELKIKKR
jgi:hypothetical protein